MTYVNRRTRLFLEEKDLRPERRRSEGRLKTYPSAEDVRAWCDTVDDRRRHILELVTKDVEKCKKTLVPPDVLAGLLGDGHFGRLPIARRTLLKTARPKDEKECVAADRHAREAAEVRAAIAGTHKIITRSDKPGRIVTKVVGLKPGFEIKPASQDSTRVRTVVRGVEAPGKGTGRPGEAPGAHGKVAGEDAAGPSRTPGASGAVKKPSGRLEDAGKGPGAPGETIATPGKTTGRPGEAPGALTKPSGRLEDAEKGPGAPGENIATTGKATGRPGEAPGALTKPSGRLEDARKSPGAPGEITSRSGETPGALKKPSGRPGETPGGPGETPGAPKKPSSRLEDTSVPGAPEKATAGKPSGRPGEPSPGKRTVRPGEPAGRAPGAPAGPSARLEEDTGGAEEAAAKRPERPSARSRETPTDATPPTSPLTPPTSPVTPPTSTVTTPTSPIHGSEGRDRLAAREAYEGEQDMLLRNLQDDNDGLKRKLEECLGQLENLKKVTNVANPSIGPGSCKDEIDALEHEIRVMRRGNLSPEEEAEVIGREVEVLRRYCLKLKTVEDENERLREKMAAAGSGGGDGVREKLEAVTRERDELANKVRKLETDLLQYKDLPEDLDVYRDRSRTLDAALAERDELRSRLDRMRDLESEAVELRAKAARLDELERRPASRRRPDATAAELELKKTASRCRCLEQDLRNAQAEKEAMARRIECACAEIERLRPLAKEAEIARLERDKLQIRANELAHLQVDNENLMLKCKCLEAAAAERDAYKRRYEEMMAMECECDALRCQAEENKCLLRERDGLKKQIRDLEACIHEQDEEIKRLMCHVEQMAKNKEETQSRVRDALATMRAEVEKKDRLIAASDERLASIQAQLKSSIQGVSCETLCYKARIEELERELGRLRGRRAAQERPNEAIGRELAAARLENEKLQEIAGKMVKITADEHVWNTLRQSECAVRKVLEELSRQYKDWDSMRGGNKKVCDCKMDAGEGEKT